MLMVRVEHGDRPRYELRHAGCVGEGELIEGVASPMQPNRYDYEDADEYERAVTAAFACARCGDAEVDGLGGGGDGSGTAPGAGNADGSGDGDDSVGTGRERSLDA